MTPAYRVCLLAVLALVAAQVVPGDANCGCGQPCSGSCCTSSLCPAPQWQPTSCGLEASCCNLADTLTCKAGTCVYQSTGDCSSGQGDPYFVGFDGSLYEFAGYANAYFSLISERSHLVNAWFAPTPEQPDNLNANSMQQLGFVYSGHKINVTILAQSLLSVEVDGAPMAFVPEAVTRELSGGASVRLEDRRHVAGQLSQVAIIDTPAFNFAVFAPPASVLKDFDGTGLKLSSRRHMEQPISANVHGVLGITLQPSWHSKVAGVALAGGLPTFAGEGEAKDYEVSGLFAGDNKFSAFTGEELAPKTAARAEHRKLIADDVPLVEASAGARTL